jgi:Protein of unknown function VcgC/VcgE (DUF2780)
MIRKPLFNVFIITVLSVLWLVCIPVNAADLDIVGLLTKQLGVSKDQAKGGAGSIFQTAKQKLNVADFASISKAVPGMDKLLGSAPKPKKSSGTLGSLTSMAGGSSSKLKGLAGLTGSFKQLGMSGDMVGKFMPIILDYVQNNGGDKAKNLLKGALN